MTNSHEALVEQVIVTMLEHLVLVRSIVPEIAFPRVLSMAQMRALMTIADHPSTTNGELADRLKITPPTASHLVDRLALLGLIAREDDPSDRRRSLLTLTTEGRDLVLDLRAGPIGPPAIMRRCLERLDTNDLTALLRGFSALITSLRELAQEEGLSPEMFTRAGPADLRNGEDSKSRRSPAS